MTNDQREIHRKKRILEYAERVGNINKTITLAPTFASLGLLAVLVVVRTVVSWTLTLEIEGRWPWQRKQPTA